MAWTAHRTLYSTSCARSSSRPRSTRVEGGPAMLVDAEFVVEFAWSVDTDPNEEALRRKELRPSLVEQRPVCLHRVQEALVRAAARLGERDEATEEGESHQRRLAALPGDRDLGRVVGLDDLADIGLGNLVTHAETGAGIERFLVEVEAVGAIEVADRSGRLRHHVEAPWRSGWAWDGHWGPHLGTSLPGLATGQGYRDVSHNVVSRTPCAAFPAGVLFPNEESLSPVFESELGVHHVKGKKALLIGAVDAEGNVLGYGRSLARSDVPA